MSPAVNRTGRSLQEIAQLPALDTETRVLGHLAVQGAGLAPETLVVVLRDQRRRGHVAAAQRCAELLIGQPLEGGVFRGGHCEPIIRATARDFGFSDDSDDLDEFRARCYAALTDAIVEGSGKQQFWEERFFLALKRRAIDAGRAMRVESQALVRIDEEYLAVDGPLVIPEEQVSGRIDEQSIMQALRSLPGPQARAGWLVWVKGWPVESQNPEAMTVAKAMGVSGRMVRQYLAKARGTLMKDPVIAEAFNEIVGR